MSILQCDICKNLLEEAVLLPCGYTVCKQHTEDAEPNSSSASSLCSFCSSIHHGPYVKNLKIIKLVDLFKSVKNSCNRLEESINKYNELKTRPNHLFEAHFDQLERQILSQKQNIIDFLVCQVEVRASKCLTQINDWREQYALSNDSPRQNHNSTKYIEEITRKAAEFKSHVSWSNISENSWNYIIQTSDELNKKITEQTETLKRSYLPLNLKFQSNFIYKSQLEFGQIVTGNVFAAQKTTAVTQPNLSESLQHLHSAQNMIDTGLTLRAFLETKNQPNDNSEPEEARASVSNDRDDILTEDLLMFNEFRETSSNEESEMFETTKTSPSVSKSASTSSAASLPLRTSYIKTIASQLSKQKSQLRGKVNPPSIARRCKRYKRQSAKRAQDMFNKLNFHQPSTIKILSS